MSQENNLSVIHDDIAEAFRSVKDFQPHLVINLDMYGDLDNIDFIYHGATIHLNIDKMLELGIVYI